MSHITAMLHTSPADPGVDREALGAAIAALNDCAQACTTCADADITEGGMATCARRCSDCADVCVATSRVLSRQHAVDAEVWRSLLQACITACMACAQECAGHDTAHCTTCAERCSTCIDACERLLGLLPAGA